jgi:hypothetical protein
MTKQALGASSFACRAVAWRRREHSGFFAGGGVAAGIRLGILVEIAAIGMRLAIYAVQPFPAKLIVYGSASGLIEMVIVGAIVGTIYKPACARTP